MRMETNINSMVIFHPFLIMFCTLLLSLSLSLSLSDHRCNPDDKKALFAIKTALNNPYILTSWKPEEDCCTWYLVKCDPTTNRIKSLAIFSDTLPGRIPAAVGDLPYLEDLDFNHLSNFTGTIPSSISKLKNLKFLRLSRLNLYGSVPDSLSQLTRLEYLSLSFNQLSGSIPSSLSKLHNLNYIGLDRNRLTGTIPESFARFTGKTLRYLYLSHNQLSGIVPVSLGKINFDTVDLSRNKLKGHASFLFGSKKTTFRVDISRNLFEFNLSKVEFPKSLANLDINHNRIYGSIPEGMTLLELQSLNVSYNRLCGDIPKGGRLQGFDYSVYFHNKCLCGLPLRGCK